MTNMIITTDSPLHPCNVNFVLPVAGTDYNGEQAFRIAEATQLGLRDTRLNLRDDLWRRRPDLLEQVSMPRHFAQYTPLQWVENRSLVRQSIFAAAINDVPGFNDALKEVAAGTQFLFADNTGRCQSQNYYDYWNTATNSITLQKTGGVGCFGRNMMGRDLAIVQEGGNPNMNLADWLSTNYCWGPGPRYGFMIIGDNTLQFLDYVESGAALIKDALRFHDIPVWLRDSQFSPMFRNIIIHCGIEDISSSPAQIEKYFDDFALYLSDCSDSVYISAPVPQPATVCSSDDLANFKAQLQRMSRSYGFHWMDSDMLGVNSFRHPTLALEPNFYDTFENHVPHLNFAGNRELVRLWESFIPDIKKFGIGFSHIRLNERSGLRLGYVNFQVLRDMFFRNGCIHGQSTLPPLPSVGV